MGQLKIQVCLHRFWTNLMRTRFSHKLGDYFGSFIFVGGPELPCVIEGCKTPVVSRQFRLWPWSDGGLPCAIAVSKPKTWKTITASLRNLQRIGNTTERLNHFTATESTANRQQYRANKSLHCHATKSAAIQQWKRTTNQSISTESAVNGWW